MQNNGVFGVGFWHKQSVQEFTCMPYKKIFIVKDRMTSRLNPEGGIFFFVHVHTITFHCNIIIACENCYAQFYSFH